MKFIERNSVKVLLLNEKKELLLVYADHPSTTTLDGVYHGPFWFNVGGEIELNETIQEAAIREIFEETGIKKEKVDLGPIVWFGQCDLMVGTRRPLVEGTWLLVERPCIRRTSRLSRPACELGPFLTRNR